MQHVTKSTEFTRSWIGGDRRVGYLRVYRNSRSREGIGVSQIYVYLCRILLEHRFYPLGKRKASRRVAPRRGARSTYFTYKQTTTTSPQATSSTTSPTSSEIREILVQRRRHRNVRTTAARVGSLHMLPRSVHFLRRWCDSNMTLVSRVQQAGARAFSLGRGSKDGSGCGSQ